MRIVIILALNIILLAACGGPQRPSQRNMFDDDVDLGDSEQTVTAERHPATVLVKEGESALTAGKLDKAKALFEQAIAEDAKDPRARLDLGLCYELINDFEKAEAQYRVAIKIDADFPEANNNLGLLLRDLKRYPESIAVLKHATEVKPDMVEARLNLAMTLEESGNAKEAEREYREVIRLAPKEALPRANLGLLLLSQDDKEQAALELRRALRFAGENATVLQAVGNGLRRAGHGEPAVQAMQRAIEAHGKKTPALLSELALAYRSNDQIAEAQTTLKEAIGLDKSFAIAHYLLAGLLATDKKYAEAIKHYDTFLSLEPSGPQADKARRHRKAAKDRL